MPEIKDPRILEHRTNREREIRDLYHLLSKKYNTDTLMAFFLRNYGIGESSIYAILSRVDNRPVSPEWVSIQYLTATKPDFNL